jgi:hypothetical protein
MVIDFDLESEEWLSTALQTLGNKVMYFFEDKRLGPVGQVTTIDITELSGEKVPPRPAGNTP